MKIYEYNDRFYTEDALITLSLGMDRRERAELLGGSGETHEGEGYYCSDCLAPFRVLEPMYVCGRLMLCEDCFDGLFRSLNAGDIARLGHLLCVEVNE